MTVWAGSLVGTALLMSDAGMGRSDSQVLVRRRDEWEARGCRPETTSCSGHARRGSGTSEAGAISSISLPTRVRCPPGLARRPRPGEGEDKIYGSYKKYELSEQQQQHAIRWKNSKKKRDKKAVHVVADCRTASVRPRGRACERG